MIVKFRGYKFAPGTPAAIRWAEKRAGFTFRISQGGYNQGGVSASAGTHDKDAVDFTVRGLTHAQVATMVRALRDAGFAAWHRTTNQGFDSEHVHAVRLGNGDLSRVAAQQAIAYDAHRDGLKSNAPDNTYHPQPKVRWGLLVNKPVIRK